MALYPKRTLRNMFDDNIKLRTSTYIKTVQTSPEKKIFICDILMYWIVTVGN